MAECQLTPETLPAYLAERGLVSDPAALCVRELGGGVSNLVLLVEGPGVRWVAKQSLARLRVKDDWTSQRERIFREAAAIELLAPVLNGAVPKVVLVDRANFLFVMTAAPQGSVVWKESLLEGHVSMEVAEQAGAMLAAIIKASQQGPAFRQQFADRTVFDELRIDPYYRTTASRCREAREALERLIDDSWKIQTSLVHGDYSPKNVLLSGDGIFLIDFEVAHWGDPAFDSGFLLNHLMLKSFHQPQYAELYLRAARSSWQALVTGLEGAHTMNFEPMTVRHLGGLMLARMDGKSPVEYIRDEAVKSRVRRAAVRLLKEHPEKFEAALDLVAQSVRQT